MKHLMHVKFQKNTGQSAPFAALYDNRLHGDLGMNYQPKAVSFAVSGSLCRAFAGEK